MQDLPVVLTGIRSNGELTLGNYIGAIKPMTDMQKKYKDETKINFFVPDLHSFTTPTDFSTLYSNTINNIKTFIACGLDINSKNCYIYRQSKIPAHSELTWILDCFIHVGELNRMTQYKEKSEGRESVSVGLFNYPALMAADILLYDTTYVPVGEDQRQHLELTRDIAIRINNYFKQEIFVVPKAWKEQLKFVNLDKGIRIRSLKDPSKKMSKSITDPSGTILLSDDPGAAAKKILAATTDSFNLIDYDLIKQPGISNLLQIAALLDGNPLNILVNKWKGRTSYGELKKYTAELTFNFLTNFQQKLKTIDETILIEKLEEDEIKIQDISNKKLEKIQKLVGLIKS